ncbi:type IV pilus twitching motility protein PilT [Budvicia diplopodorum]|uniref:type IV pilus twitching motility protein PilT n=1 Tax=Budvicia diplopodorum TaxID=1119056 RepID=UPI0013576452|nr:type IV pilus twitching motility protein PilT [Budvicia diplopodorum]
MKMCELVALSVKQNASDLHLSAGHLPMLRVNGDLRACGDHKLDSQWLNDWLLLWLSADQQQQFSARGQLDCAITLNGGVRLRANFFQQRSGISVALRFIQTVIPDVSTLGIPTALIDISDRDDGLVIIAGATGSGKSTTLASLIAGINQRASRHIITLEDPIEFIHQSHTSLIQQREIGVHAESFSLGLRAALRQDPDIILLGELRDAETIRLALTAAETGHLVFATLHTRSAIQLMERIIDVFPAEEKRFVSTQLANSLQAVVCQRLLPDVQGSRVAAYEVLINTPAVSNMIRENKTHQLQSILQTGSAVGMQTMEQSIRQLISQGRVAECHYSSLP